MMIPWLNIELTSRCNKSCWFCGRAELRRIGKMETGDIDLSLFESIIDQFTGMIVQFNRDGEPLLYEHLAEIGKLCEGRIANIVTNGLLLWHRRHDVMDFTSICVSVMDDDEEQFESVRKFAALADRPELVIKFLGKYHNPAYEELGITTRRAIHHPLGDWDYDKPPVVPEIGVCLDFLMKPSIDWRGNFSICNRFDPFGLGVIGDCTKQSLAEIWQGPLREEWMILHKHQMRHMVPLCKGCMFWGVAHA